MDQTGTGAWPGWNGQGWPAVWCGRPGVMLMLHSVATLVPGAVVPAWVRWRRGAMSKVCPGGGCESLVLELLEGLGESLDGWGCGGFCLELLHRFIWKTFDAC